MRAQRPQAYAYSCTFMFMFNIMSALVAECFQWLFQAVTGPGFKPQLWLVTGTSGEVRMGWSCMLWTSLFL